MNTTVNFLQLQNVPISEQLQFEEALLRLTDENWCIINEGSPPSIIMGISGNPEELINASMMEKSPVPLIKRYSGGGTVIVDNNTLFVSFIFQKKIHDFPCFPEPILRWSESFYQKALGIPDFQLRENDYVIGKHKCGGNAQYIQKHRFVHHTTFLWDFDPSNMDYLLYPKKSPKYREGRPHEQFLCRLKNFLPSKPYFITQVVKELKTSYTVKKTSLNPLIPLLKMPHRKTTTHVFIPS